MKKKKTYSLRKLREKNHVTLKQLSAATGIPVSTISSLERGLGRGFSSATKHTLSDYFAVPFFSLWPEEFEKMRAIAGGNFQLQIFFRPDAEK